MDVPRIDMDTGQQTDQPPPLEGTLHTPPGTPLRAASQSGREFRQEMTPEEQPSAETEGAAEMTARLKSESVSQQDAGSCNEVSDNSASDVETFVGKIVYNHDGSAYIIEPGDSEVSDDDCSLDLPQQERSPLVAPADLRTVPQVVNALHIARHPALYSALYGQAFTFLRRSAKVPEIPVMHSYRVFTVREGKGGRRPAGADKAGLPLLDLGTVPIKPVLMCFMCKLSFGFTKSFVAHAVGEHGLSLMDEERELMACQNASAIIQGVGKEKEPLLSFLEPIPTSAQVSNVAQHSSSSCFSTNVVSPSAVSTSSGGGFPPSAVTTLVSASSNPVPSVPDLASTVKKEGSSGTFGEVLAPELEDLANIEKMAEAAAAAAAAATEAEGIPPSLAAAEKTPEECLQQRLVSNGSTGPEGRHTPLVPMSSCASSLERPISRDSTGSLSPGVRVSPKGHHTPLLPTCHSPSPSTSSVLGICSQHPDGKTNGVECPKCDMVLGSSRSLGGHMTMMHSRNSCKTLKCPKCNWHYKYQETLEIHMKEKHPENEMTCLYCLTNQPHPRLARGETYTCGYKPYRCEVCNYSTTTKGNLSIHMQSDKHINNVQELQNGTLPPDHVLQPPSVAAAPPPPPPPVPEPLKKSPAAPKPKATWRCDVCNYETNVARNLRIHMTSEKHTHNMMVLQQNMKHMQHLSALQQAQALEPVLPFHPGLLMPPDSQLQPEAALADMAYNHALLMMASQQHQQQQQHHQQQQQQQQQRALAAAAAAAAAAKSSMGGQLPMSCAPSIDVDHPDPTFRPDIPYDDSFKLFQCCVCTLYSADTVEALHQHVQQDRTRLREDEVLTAVAGTYICKLCTYKTNLKANFQLHCKTDKHLQRLQHVNHIKEGGHRNDWKLKYVNVSNPVQARCNACDYYTNSLHKLQLHTASPRHEANGRLFLHLQHAERDIKSSSRTYHCNLCNVAVRSKVLLIQHVNSLPHLRNENLRQLTPKSDMDDDPREIFVVKEDRTDLHPDNDPDPRTADIAHNEIDGPSDGDKAEEAATPKTEDTSMLKQALLDKGSAEVSTAGSDSTHTCPFCTYTTTSEVRIQMHVVSQHSQRTTSMLCPLCQEAFKEWTRLENHLVDVHSVNQEGVQRLLMMVDQSEWMPPPPSGSNTTNKNSSSSVPNPPAEETAEPKPDAGEVDNKSDSGSGDEEVEDYFCPACGKVFVVLEELFCHQHELSHLEPRQTPRGQAYFCWKKGCTQYFHTMATVQIHYKELHAKKPPLAVSERHVYKYRCGQCSLAFKTREKLELHSQYHVIRAATKCVLCGRSFRTVIALQKHVETSHSDMTKEEMEQYRVSLANNPLLTGSGGVLDPHTTELLKKESKRSEDAEEIADEDVVGVEDELVAEGEETGEQVGKEQQVLEDYINSQAIAEDSYNDPSRKYKCHRCKVAFTRQSYLTSHNKTLLHRKGEKMSYPMEKYLDPNRPFKCEVCKESFTQKNILLVHYNSVSHLHKLKISMKESSTSAASTTTTTSVTTTSSSPTSLSTPLPITTPTSTTSTTTATPTTTTTCTTSTTSVSPGDSEKKPYKCNICKVAYTQGSTLDIHVRSVLHQTRASKLHELAMTGQLDLGAPLIERPDPSQEQPPKTPEVAAAPPSLPQVTSPPLQSSRILDLPSTTSSSPANAPVTCPSPQMSFHMSTEPSPLSLFHHLAQPPVLVSSQMSPQPIITCQRCGAFFMSQESLIQHQQLYCFFSQPPPPLLAAAPTTPQPSPIPGLSQPPPPHLPRLGMPQEREEQQQQRCSQPPRPETVETPTPHQSQTSPTPGQMMRSKFALPRTKPPMFRHLLESFGFDVVMQFNEMTQKKPRKESEKKEAEGDAVSSQKSTVEDSKVTKNDEEKRKEKRIDLPEINRSVCHQCGRDFSSIWVLKCHQEEVHKNIVPVAMVEKFAEEFKTDYDRRNNSSSSAPVLDEVGSLSDATSPSSSGEPSNGPSSTPATPSALPPLSIPTSATPPVTSLASQAVDIASSVTASQMAAQLQFNQLLMSMGLGMGLPMGMNMNMNIPFPAAMNLHPPLIPLMMPPPFDPLMASAFNHPMIPGPMDPNFFAAQKLLQQQQLAQAQQQKRARTRISDDQLKILRAYFDINNSPTEEQLIEMSEKSGLPLKVIKHWFRNTLFKERQRNKDSPYNFSNPPSTFLNLEEYEKTGEARIISTQLHQHSNSSSSNNHNSSSNNHHHHHHHHNNNEEVRRKGEKCDDSETPHHKTKTNCERLSNPTATPPLEDKDKQLPFLSNAPKPSPSSAPVSIDPPTCTSLVPVSTISPTSTTSTAISSIVEPSEVQSVMTSDPGPLSLPPFLAMHSHTLTLPPTSCSPPTSESPHSTGTPSGTTTPTTTTSGKRANRTRFTDYQIKVLQEFFETNAYPKDDDLEYLSKLLNLSPRVIVVWFQNARQKARKVYENQPPATPTEEETSGRFQRTPGLNYQCKKCSQVFQRYYELIKHQKSSCFKDENPLAAQIKLSLGGSEDRSQTSPLTSPGQSLPRPPDKFGQNGTYRCEKCSLAFPRFDLWREHQLVHMMNPSLFPNYANSTFSMITPYDAQASALPQLKRKMSDDEDSTPEQPKDKRLRTTILPEQLDYLYQQYQVESNPSRKMLENIAKDVGLKKRVVQVWFQNTRARERKGQFRAHQQVIHKRCPFCRALFKARSALESHLATRHADQYTKGDINIDALPDGEGDSNPEDPTCSSPLDDKPPTSLPSPSPPVSCPSTSADTVQNTMKRYYEDSLRKYLDELCSPSHVSNKDAASPGEASGKSPVKGEGKGETGDSPLDLSKPLKIGGELEKTNGSLVLPDDGTSRATSADDARSETHSESTDNMDCEDVSYESNPTSPSPHSQRRMTGSGKRFRTQMTTVQLKVMKSIFVDYKTPSMAECETMGREIGLPKRVVQVWFQNARAKEKKAKLAFAKTFGHEMDVTKPPEECTLCGVKYNLKFSASSLQEHIFSRKHIDTLKNHIDNMKKITEGQDSMDRTDASTPISAGGISASQSDSTLDRTRNSATTNTLSAPPVLMQMMGLSQMPSSIPGFGQSSGGLPNPGPETEKNEMNQRRDSESLCGAAAKVKEEKDTTLPTTAAPPQPTMSQDNALLGAMGDFMLPTSEAAGLFPYMYAGFSGYYPGVPGAFLQPTVYPGRTKL